MVSWALVSANGEGRYAGELNIEGHAVRMVKCEFSTIHSFVV
jgi:hypothetical protein